MDTLESVQRTLEEAGVEFITGGNGPGVRLRRRSCYKQERLLVLVARCRSPIKVEGIETFSYEERKTDHMEDSKMVKHRGCSGCGLLILH